MTVIHAVVKNGGIEAEAPDDWPGDIGGAIEAVAAIEGSGESGGADERLDDTYEVLSRRHH